MLDHVATPSNITLNASLKIVRIISLNHLTLESLRCTCVAAEAYHRAQVIVRVILAVAMDPIGDVTVYARSLTCLCVASRVLVAALLLRSCVLLWVYVRVCLL